MALRHRASIICLSSILFCFGFVHGSGKKYTHFPPGFVIGSATSSHQIEGAWNASDKGESVWDHYTHTKPHKIANGANGDVACDSYHKYKEDAQMVKDLGMDFYRFSFSWTRILPTGYSNVISKDGVAYYHRLLDELERHNITPLATIYHWDHPQLFESMGGWTNEVMIDLYVDYARVIFQEFGHRIKTFATINEPEGVCRLTYLEGKFAPGVKLGDHGLYLCSKNLVKAHARAYHMYNEEFKPKQKGKVGIVINMTNYWSRNKADNVSADVAFQFQFGLFAHPIYSAKGGWPEAVKTRVDRQSKAEGLPRSRLPEFTEREINDIRGAHDFLGLNYYTTNYAEPTSARQSPTANQSLSRDDGLSYSFNSQWKNSSTSWLKVVPEGFLAALVKVKEEYNNPMVIVTENGVSDSGTLVDCIRLDYLYSHIQNMLIAINDYGCNVTGYTVWSLMDNMEWASGYTEKFGLYHVDFTSPNRTRTPKESAKWLKKVIRARQLLPIPELDSCRK